MNILTDQEFTYRETPVSYDGLAKFESIKGNTVIWNQLCDYSRSTQTVNYVTYTNNGDGSCTINGTASATSLYQFTEANVIITNSHKYLFKGADGGSSNCRLDIRKSDSSIISGTINTGTDIMFVAEETVLAKIMARVGSGVTISNVIFKPQLFDLTAMFGAGNEPATTEEFASLFPLHYYEYDAGSLLNFTATSIKTTDGNGTTSTSVLPIADYFPTGMKSAGDVYDELTPFKAITRVGTRAYQNGDENDPSVITDGTNTNYVLLTPTETDGISLEYSFYKYGTEEILPGTYAPILANIVYYSLTEGAVPYRKFWMVNAKGDRWNMTEREEKSFLNNPQGLGYAKSLSTIRYGNRQNLTDVTDNFPQPSGEILFYDSANSSRYERYNEFVRFLSYYPITLYYQIPVSYYSHIQNIYTLDCVVGSLTKTESKTDGILRCSITFNALSFYKGETVEISGSGSTYTITNDGDFPVGFEITIEGSPVNPYVQLEQDNELYGEAKFINSTAFDSVYVNSNDGEQNVILEQGGSVLPNPLSYQDLSISNGSIYVTFVKLARGESDLTIGMDSGSLTSVEIRFTPIYRSV